jgi:hypothetical protein
MSTRCQLVVQGNEKVKIYKHSDGYPSGVLPILKEFLPAFKKGRGFDAEYLTAHLSAALIFADQVSRVKYNLECIAKGEKPLFNEDYVGFLGHGLDGDWHGDIEFVYNITPEFSVEVYKIANVSTAKNLFKTKGCVLLHKYTLEELITTKKF